MNTLPDEILSGALLGCGALFALAGTAKLGRTARRTAVDGGAVRAALRISPARWRRVELLAGVAETATGVAVCLNSLPRLAGAAMATQGAIFMVILAWARRVGAPGGCGCVRRTKDPDAALGRSVIVRAGFLFAAGVVQALLGAHRPSLLSRSGPTAAVIALGVLLVLLDAEQPWRTARCGRRIWLPRRDAAKVLMNHGVFTAMSAAAGPFTAGYTHRREGCADVFRFPAPRRAVVFRVSRTRPGGSLTVEAAVETDHIPVAGGPE
jgi:hypothetical protein